MLRKIDGNNGLKKSLPKLGGFLVFEIFFLKYCYKSSGLIMEIGETAGQGWSLNDIWELYGGPLLS